MGYRMNEIISGNQKFSWLWGSLFDIWCVETLIGTPSECKLSIGTIGFQ